MEACSRRTQGSCQDTCPFLSRLKYFIGGEMLTLEEGFLSKVSRSELRARKKVGIGQGTERLACRPDAQSSVCRLLRAVQQLTEE